MFLIMITNVTSQFLCKLSYIGMARLKAKPWRKLKRRSSFRQSVKVGIKLLILGCVYTRLKNVFLSKNERCLSYSEKY